MKLVINFAKKEVIYCVLKDFFVILRRLVANRSPARDAFGVSGSGKVQSEARDFLTLLTNYF